MSVTFSTGDPSAIYSAVMEMDSMNSPSAQQQQPRDSCFDSTAVSRVYSVAASSAIPSRQLSPVPVNTKSSEPRKPSTALIVRPESILLPPSSVSHAGCTPAKEPRVATSPPPSSRQTVLGGPSVVIPLGDSSMSVAVASPMPHFTAAPRPRSAPRVTFIEEENSAREMAVPRCTVTPSRPIKTPTKFQPPAEVQVDATPTPKKARPAVDAPPPAEHSSPTHLDSTLQPPDVQHVVRRKSKTPRKAEKEIPPIRSVSEEVQAILSRQAHQVELPRLAPAMKQQHQQQQQQIVRKAKSTSASRRDASVTSVSTEMLNLPSFAQCSFVEHAVQEEESKVATDEAARTSQKTAAKKAKKGKKGAKKRQPAVESQKRSEQEEDEAAVEEKAPSPVKAKARHHHAAPAKKTMPKAVEKKSEPRTHTMSKRDKKKAKREARRAARREKLERIAAAKKKKLRAARVQPPTVDEYIPEAATEEYQPVSPVRGRKAKTAATKRPRDPSTREEEALSLRPAPQPVVPRRSAAEVVLPRALMASAPQPQPFLHRPAMNRSKGGRSKSRPEGGRRPEMFSVERELGLIADHPAEAVAAPAPLVAPRMGRRAAQVDPPPAAAPPAAARHPPSSRTARALPQEPADPMEAFFEAAFPQSVSAALLELADVQPKSPGNFYNARPAKRRRLR